MKSIKRKGKLGNGWQKNYFCPPFVGRESSALFSLLPVRIIRNTGSNELFWSNGQTAIFRLPDRLFRWWPKSLWKVSWCWKYIHYRYRLASSVRYLRITSADYREIIAGGLCADDLNLPIREQSEQTFRKVEEILKAEQMNFGDIVRQWNYLEGITDIAHGNQCYQDFNDVRSQFYATSEWQSGYPAATGIGAQHGGIQIDFNAVSGKIGIIPLDNDWQRAAHVYSDEVLISHRPDTEKGTPKFERGKSLSDHQQEVIYISGTAAIRGEESMVTGDVLWQTEITLENIQHLIGLEEGKEKLPEHSGKLELLRVYLKNEKDAQIVKEDLDKLCPGVPVAYLYADVCREELLVEIEGIAHL